MLCWWRFHQTSSGLRRFSIALERLTQGHARELRRSGVRTAMHCQRRKNRSDSGTASAIRRSKEVEFREPTQRSSHSRPANSSSVIPMRWAAFKRRSPNLLGRNGTYVVFRKLHQRVAEFRRFLKANSTSADDEELLAAKMMGRWRSGAPLALCPLHDNPELGADPHRNNDFLYEADDPAGLKTPGGSHIRRTNPRDASIAGVARIHRMIRRGTAYGTMLPEGNSGRRRRRSRLDVRLCRSSSRATVRVRPVSVDQRRSVFWRRRR